MITRDTVRRQVAPRPGTILSRTYTIVFVLILVLAVTLAGNTAKVHAQSPTDGGSDTITSTDTEPLPSHIAIRVENETVPMETFQNRVDNLVEQYVSKAKKSGKDYDREEARANFGDRIKRKIISRLLLEVHARRAGTRVPEEKFKNTWQSVIDKAGSREEYREKIEEKGMTMKEARQQVRNELRRRQYIKEQMPEVSVSDTEVLKVYRKNREQLKGFGQRRALQFIKKRLIKKKENQASKVFIGKLRRKSLVQTNV